MKIIIECSLLSTEYSNKLAKDEIIIEYYLLNIATNHPNMKIIIECYLLKIAINVIHTSYTFQLNQGIVYTVSPSLLLQYFVFTHPIVSIENQHFFLKCYL